MSKYMGNIPVGLRYMLGIDIDTVSFPEIEYQHELSKDNPKVRQNFKIDNNQKSKKQIATFQLDDRYWIWDYFNGKDIESSEIYSIYKYILSEIESSKLLKKGIFSMDLENEIDKSKIKKSPIIPIIYQPALDSLKNYAREVHCAAIKPNIIEISIIFNNEQLRRHKIANNMYEKIRLLKYGRTMDIETFRICNDNQLKEIDKNYFIFENIYSDHYELIDDSIHGDPRILHTEK